jgi:hypothetical protein
MYKNMRQLFLDCDGVLADFDGYAEKVFGLPPRDYEDKMGTDRFWADTRSHHDFYYNLPVLPDGVKLYEAVKHLKPIILTGRPSHDGGRWAIEQKQRWAATHFPGVEIIVCLSKEKCQHMKRFGDILVDDRLKYRRYWTEAGGVFVHHRSSDETINLLRELEVL